MSLRLRAARALARWRSRPDDAPDPEAMLRALDPHRTMAPPPPRLERSHAVHAADIAGRPVLTLTPRRAPADPAQPMPELVYLSGGGYVLPMSERQWRTVGVLARASGARVTVPGYGLAPEHQVDAALDLLDLVMAQVRSRAEAAGPRRARVVVVGNSAGGGLALAHAIRARDAGGPQADALVLLAPWVEATMTNPEAKALEARDVTLRCGTLAAAARAWAGARPVEDPLISPLSDRLEGLPPLSVHQGDHDIFLPDVCRFAAKAEAAGTAVTLRIYPGAHHGYTGAIWTPEAKRTLAESARVVVGRG